MAATLVHRGPDDEGHWFDGEAGLGFGFRRLSIIDLSEQGHQPMRSHSGRFTLLHNGEIYNHEALRRRLESAGARFRGTSDTEVILAAIEAWGIAGALTRLEGMFALAIWDSRNRSLSLVRDRLGIKPLFFSATRGMIAFASELKALVTVPDFERTVDREALTAYLRHLYVPAPLTIYANARKLRPGHVLTVTDPDARTPESEAFWSLREVAARGRSQRFDGSPDDAVDALDELLSDSIRAHLRSDVPLGAFLSAGIDSGTVVSMMQEASDRPISSFSVAFDIREHNEAPEAARVAEHLGTDHTEIRLTGREALEVIPRLPDIFDEPHADTSQIPVYMLCAKARKTVTVALSGDGGDEVFAGYNRYTYGPRMFAKTTLVPRAARTAMAAGLSFLSARSWDRVYGACSWVLPSSARERLVGEKLRKLRGVLRAATWPEMYRSLVSVWERPEDLVRGGTETRGAFEETLEEDGTATMLDRIILADQLAYLPDDQLAKVDRASMAVGLEVRVPLVDHRIVEFAWSLPPSLKIREGSGKWLLRQVLYRRVPKSLMERPKMGLSVPLSRWLRGPLRSWAEGLLEETRLEREGLLDPRAVRQAWSKLLRGNEEDALGLWAVLMFQAWQERWL